MLHRAHSTLHHSDYAEFDDFLDQRHFLATLLAAFMLHALGFAIYYLMPTQVIEEIPVRVLNVKLGGDVNASAITSADINRLFAKRRLAQQGKASPSRAETLQKVISSRQAQEARERVESASISENAPAPAKAEKRPQQATPRAAMEEVKPDPAPEPKVQKEPAPKPEKPKPAPLLKKPAPKPKAPSRKPPKVNDKPTEEAIGRRYVRENQLANRGDQAENQSARGKQGEGSLIGNSDASDAQLRTRYTQTISLWIDKHKVYPEAARAAGEGGKVVLRIRINRQGRILRYLLEKSSGSEAIDRAITQMIDAANPLPAVPSDYPDKTPYLEFLIPINFIP